MEATDSRTGMKVSLVQVRLYFPVVRLAFFGIVVDCKDCNL